MRNDQTVYIELDEDGQSSDITEGITLDDDTEYVNVGIRIPAVFLKAKKAFMISIGLKGVQVQGVPDNRSLLRRIWDMLWN
jgi:hypothetical protein